MRFPRMVALGVGVALVAGCTQDSNMGRILRGPGTEFDPGQLQTYTTAQDDIYRSLLPIAGLREDPSTPPQWAAFVRAGIQYADAQCEEYMNALFWLDRAKDRTTTQINLAGAAASGIMGILGAAANAIAVTGVAFGLGSATVENIGSGLLYDLDPSAVREIVERLQAAYNASLPPTGYENRPAAFHAIRGYVALCLPPTIETEVTKAVKTARIESQPGNAATGAPPRVGVEIQRFAVVEDDAGPLLLERWSLPDGTIRPERAQEAQEALAAAGLRFPRDINVFLFTEPHAAARRDLATRLQLRRQ